SDDPLDQLATAAATVADLSEVGDAVLGYHVDRARHAGASWTAISAALGVSKQAAHKRFAAATRPPGLDRFTDRARRVLSSATEVARGLGHAYVGTEHLLLALYTDPVAPVGPRGEPGRVGGGLAAQVLRELGLDRQTAQARVVDRCRGTSRPRTSTRWWSPTHTTTTGRTLSTSATYGPCRPRTGPSR